MSDDAAVTDGPDDAASETSADTRLRRPAIRKLGTLDCDVVETTPILCHGRLYRFEYIRNDYPWNEVGQSYFRLVHVASGATTPPFAVGWHLGSAYSDGDAVYAFGVDRAGGGQKLGVFWSRDLRAWDNRLALDLPAWGMHNISVCRGDDRYMMAIEVDRPEDNTIGQFTIRFAESRDLLNWTVLPPERVFGRERYAACPTIRYVDGAYYLIYLEYLECRISAYLRYDARLQRPHLTYRRNRPYACWESHIVRSADLIDWEMSPVNPVLRHGLGDRTIASPHLGEAARQRIRATWNRNNSDVDLCEYEGRTVLYYAWGDQRNDNFLAHAVYEGPLDELLRGFFPTDG